jgi:tol-pal system protein YbgF
MTSSSFRAIRTSAFAAMLLAASAVSASAQDSDQPSGFFDRLFGGSERMALPQGRVPDDEQDRALTTGSNRTVAQAPSNDPVMRIDRLEAQIRQMTGIIEQLQYRNQQLEGQVRRMQEETEYRFQELRGGAPRTSAPAAAPAPAVRQATPVAPPVMQPPPAVVQQPPAVGGPPRRGDAFDPQQNPNAPGAPRPLGTTAPSAPLPPGSMAQSHDPDEVVGAPGGRGAGAPLDLSTLASPSNDPSLVPGMSAPGGEPPAGARGGAGGGQVATLPPTDSPKDSYDLAYGYILRKDYALAEEGFRVFLRKYPSDRMSPDAQYWLGESLFQRQRYRDAAETFLNVSTKYETTAKAPDALLRLGQSLAALGEREAACASFGEVLRKYPRASVSVKQGVDREQKRVRC